MPLRAHAISVLGALAGCGRIAFDELPATSNSDAAATDAEPSCPAGGCIVNHGWSKRFGSPAVDYGFDLDLLVSARQIFLTGFYAGGGVDFGGGVLPVAGLHDTMVVTYDEDGSFVAARGYGGPGFEEGFGIRLAANGDIFLSGGAQDQARFGGPPLTAQGGLDLFVVRSTQTGGYLWSALHGGAGDDRAAEMTIDDTGASYVVGQFSLMASVGGPVRTSAGGNDVFVVRYAGDGGLRWDRTWGGTGNDTGRSIAFAPASQMLYVSGSFTGTMDVGTGPLSSAGETDGFLVALDASTGATRWAITWGSASEDGCNGIVVDAEGNAYVAGYFSDTIQLGTGTLTSAGAEDLMLFSVTPAGTVRWATRHGGAGQDRGIRTAIGPHGEVITGGLFHQTGTFGSETLTSSGGSDAFVMATTASGRPLWVRGFGGPGDDEVQSVVVDDLGRIYATGAFSNTITFGGAPLTSAGGLDTFLIRLDPEIVVPTQ